MKSEIATPQKAIVGIYRKIPRVSMAAFLTVFFGGLLIHMYRLCNMALVVETPYFFYNEDNRTDHGRWFLHVVTNLTSWQDMPYLNGMVALLYLAVAAALLVCLLKVESKITAVFVALVVVTSPATTVLIHFSFLADGYAAAFLLAVLAVFIVERRWNAKGWRGAGTVVLGAVLLCLSLAIYQTELDVAATLCVLLLLQGIFAGESRSIKHFWCLFLMGAGGTALYMMVTKIMFAVSGVQATEHAGLNTMGQVNLAESLKKILWLYTDSGHPYMKLLTYPTGALWQLIGWLGLLCFAGVMGTHIFKKRIYKELLPFLSSLGLLAALPLAIWFLTVLQPQNGGRNALQGYSSMLIWVALLTFGEKLGKLRIGPRSQGILQWGAWLCTAALTIHFIIFANQIYMAARVAFEKDLAATNRLLTRMELVEGYASDATVCIGGISIPYSEQGAYTEHTKKLEHYFPAVQPRTALYGQSSFLQFMNMFLSTDFVPADDGLKQAILASEEYAVMPAWPADGCVRMIDGTLVVRLWQ